MTNWNLPVDYTKLSPSQRREVRLQYQKQQNGLCSFCKQPLDGDPEAYVKKARIYKYLFPPGMFKNPVHLHHCHQTGMTIGAVHARCNAYLWQYKGE